MIRRKAGPDGSVRVTFSLPAQEPAGEVSVVGSFNDWTPGKHRLVRRAGGSRSVSVTAAKGSVLRFRYLAENGHWFDDPSADRVDAQGGEIHL
ncbi:MAG: isoamylase early set domain-containing protein [Mycobacteriales bacterium]